MRTSAMLVAFVFSVTALASAFADEAPKLKERLRFLLLTDKTTEDLRAVPVKEGQAIPESGTLVTCDAMRFSRAGTTFVNVVLETRRDKLTAGTAILTGSSIHLSRVKTLEVRSGMGKAPNP